MPAKLSARINQKKTTKDHSGMTQDKNPGPSNDRFIPKDAHRAGDVADMVNDLYRLDCEVWGHPLDAAILRCIAATQWKTGQAARVRGIANTLGVSVATVHNRLKKLCEAGPEDDGNPPSVVRDRAGRYQLNAQGDERMQEYILDVARTVALFARRRETCSVCHLARVVPVSSVTRPQIVEAPRTASRR